MGSAQCNCARAGAVAGSGVGMSSMSVLVWAQAICPCSTCGVSGNVVCFRMTYCLYLW